MRYGLGQFVNSTYPDPWSYVMVADYLSAVPRGAEGGLSLGSAKSGFYLDGGGAQLTGVNVNKNNRIYGSTGAYWTVYSNLYGTLKMGANLTGLHYARQRQTAD